MPWLVSIGAIVALQNYRFRRKRISSSGGRWRVDVLAGSWRQARAVCFIARWAST
jgi:hypothetical protein